MHKIRGAGPGGTVLGMTAGGATRRSTEAQGAGRSDKKKDEGAGQYKEVKSIRGGGGRITRWERANQGEATERHGDTQSNTTSNPTTANLTTNNSTEEDDSTNSHTEEHPAKEDAKTHTGVHKTLSGTHDSPKGLTGALKTITGMLKTLTETRDSSKALTGVRKTITRMLGTRDQDEGNDSTKTPTRVLKTPTGTRHGVKDNGTGTPTGTHKTPTGMLKTRTWTPHGKKDSSTKTHLGVHARDHNEGHQAKEDLTGTLHGEHQTDDRTPTGTNVMTWSKRNPAKKTRWKGFARLDKEVEVWSFKTNTGQAPHRQDQQRGVQGGRPQEEGRLLPAPSRGRQRRRQGNSCGRLPEGLPGRFRHLQVCHAAHPPKQARTRPEPIGLHVKGRPQAATTVGQRHEQDRAGESHQAQEHGAGPPLHGQAPGGEGHARQPSDPPRRA